MIILDIKNAFNKAPWDLIEERPKKNKDAYFQNVVENYLDDREIVVNWKPIIVTAKVPQRLVLNPRC